MLVIPAATESHWTIIIRLKLVGRWTCVTYLYRMLTEHYSSAMWRKSEIIKYLPLSTNTFSFSQKPLFCELGSTST
jgi:hypothetical protein